MNNYYTSLDLKDIIPNMSIDIEIDDEGFDKKLDSFMGKSLTEGKVFFLYQNGSLEGIFYGGKAFIDMGILNDILTSLGVTE